MAQALYAPRSVAVVGASTSRKTAWGNRTIARYRQLGWTDRLYAVHPTADAIDGVPAYKSLGDIPGGVDYAEISVAAQLAPDVLRAANGKVRVATVNAAGFSEMGEAGNSLEASLLEAATQAGFGSYENWKKIFVTVGKMRGVGWAATYQDPVSGGLSKTRRPIRRGKNSARWRIAFNSAPAGRSRFADSATMCWACCRSSSGR